MNVRSFCTRHLAHALAIVSAVIVLASPRAVLAVSPPPPRPVVTDAQLDQLKAQIDAHQTKIEDAQITALNLEQEIHKIDSEIAKGQETLNDLQKDLHRLEGVILTKEAEKVSTQRQKEEIALHTKKRLAAFYQTGEVGIINALFSATDLGDLLNLQEYVEALFRYDEQVLAGYRAQIAKLEKAKAELDGAKAELIGLIGQMKEGEASLSKSREERDALLAQAKTEQALYRQALNALEADASTLTKAIIQSRAQERKNKPTAVLRPKAKTSAATQPQSKFETFRGKLPPPAPGQIIRVFGPYLDEFGTELHADGLDLAVAPNTAVTAIHPGRVIFADAMPGYGKLVIIDHGEQYYSLLAGLASLAINKNDEVNTGDMVGTYSKAAGLVNPGLHVEIRHGSTPIDPLLWLDAKQLKLTGGAFGGSA